ncbi:MAG: DUF3520 domain-containing protein, partial [Christensenella sp.]|uniref:YfbK domain-containing protein n=1 Tax=Christensenella sp. TaxID=1935934 RepID=UPI002B20DB26
IDMCGTLFTVAKEVKLQVEFNPSKVAEYRLIGYENRRLEDEDFDDDTKDGGEIGAGHSMTAIYEIVEATVAPAEEDSGLKYQQTVTTASDEYLTVNIRYKAPDGDVSQLLSYPVDATAYSATPSDTMKYAASVAEVGMLLKQSQYAGTSSYMDAATRLEAIPSVQQDEYKLEFLYMAQTLDKMQGSVMDSERTQRWSDLWDKLGLS